MGSALDVPGEEFNPGEQTTHAAHVVVPIPAHFVAETVQHQHPALEGLQRLHDFLQLEISSRFLRPEGWRQGSIGTEQNHEALSRPGRAREAKTGETGKKGKRGRRKPKLFQEFAAMKCVHDFLPLVDGRGAGVVVLTSTMPASSF